MGKIFMVHLDCFWNRDERYYKAGNWHGTKDLDGGTLFTQFSHFIDIMYWLFGDINNIKARLESFSHNGLTAFEDSGSVLFDFARGGMGTINFSTSTWDKNMETSITVIAENGAIKIGGQYMDEIRYCHVKNYTLPQLTPTKAGNDYGPYKGSASNHNFVIDNVIEVLNNKSPSPPQPMKA
jgi:predicted dehydrogenase